MHAASKMNNGSDELVSPAMAPRVRSLVQASDPGRIAVHRVVGDQGALRELRARLRIAGVFEPVPGYYPRKLFELLALWAACIWLVWALRDSPMVVFVGLLLGLTSGQTVLLGHDATHGAAFVGRRRVARALGRAVPHLLIGLLSVGSVAWWKQSHNTHHALSNDPELDPDAYYPFLAFEPAQAAERVKSFPFFLPRQHQLVWFVVPMVAVTMRVYGVVFLVRRLVQGRGPRGQHLLALATVLVSFATYLTLVFTLLPAGRAVALIVVHQALYGTYLALIAATNHWGMPMADTARQSFFEHQVTTSRNIRGGALVRFLYGGLERQIEHHLFATLPRARLHEAAIHVQAVCRERGVPYVERTPWEALRDVYDCLRRVAHGVRPRPERHG